MRKELLLTPIVIVLLFTTLYPAFTEGTGDSIAPVRGSLDGRINGTVEGGGPKMKVELISFNSSSGQPLYFWQYTGEGGTFNRSVDSNITDIDPYRVNVNSSYYYAVVIGQYDFGDANSGNIQHVPPGALSARRVPTGNLTITVLNGTSMKPLEDAVVRIKYPQEIMELANIEGKDLNNYTDEDGNVIYMQMRSGPTPINITKVHFKGVEESGTLTEVNIGDGGWTNVTVVLQEKNWPFDVSPEEGATDFNVSGDIRIDFNDVMDFSTINRSSNYMLREKISGAEVPFTLEVAGDRTRTFLDPIYDLEYDTEYSLRLDTGFKIDGGGYPLWRAMTIDFRTELRPSTLTGDVLINDTTDPAAGVTVDLGPYSAVTNETGHYHFHIVPPGTYSLTVDESYFYGPGRGDDVIVEKGEDLIAPTVHVDAFPVGSVQLNISSEYGPIEGAWAELLEGGINQTSDEGGNVLFDRVREGQAYFEIGDADHRSTVEHVFVYEAMLAYIDITLEENPIPITLEPTEPLAEGVVRVNSSFVLGLPGKVIYSTLNATVWELDSSGNRSDKLVLKPLTKMEGSEDYLIEPIADLEMETTYEIEISKGLRLMGEAVDLLWRDVVFSFSTPDYPNSLVNGSVTLEGNPFEGIVVRIGGFSTETDEKGNFSIMVDHDSTQFSGALLVEGWVLGYENHTENLTFQAGSTLELDPVRLELMEGWYVVTPSPGTEGVPIDTEVVFTFMHPVVLPEADRQSLLSVRRNGMPAPISGQYEISEDNRTVVFTPSNLLMDSTMYIVTVTERLQLEDGRTALPVGKVTNFTTSSPSLSISWQPADLSGLALDQPIRITFGVDVVQEDVQSAFEISPEAQIWYSWPVSNREVLLRALLKPTTDYTLTLPAGDYGLNGEGLTEDFDLIFTTGDGYVGSYDLTGVIIEPLVTTNWTGGDEVKINGLNEDAAGYIVKAAIIGGGGTLVSGDTTVGDDGSWELTLTIPEVEEAGTYRLNISIGAPDADPASYLERTVTIEPKGEVKEDEEFPVIAVIAVAAVVLVLVLLVVVVLVMKKQKEKALEGPDIEYDKVDVEWQEKEE